MEAIIIILIMLFAASGWVAYGITLRLVNERDAEKERYKRALELMDARAREAIEAMRKEHDAELEKTWEDSNNRFAQGKQEGKRATLDWIKQQVDDGTLSIKVTGSPKK